MNQPHMRRVAVLAPNGAALMPMKASRARRFVQSGQAEEIRNDLRQYVIKLKREPSGYATQKVVIGLDPGSRFSGIAVQSDKATLFMAHVELPFKRVKKRLEQRRLLRRARRGRRIDRSKPFNERAHRQKRFNNRRQNKLPPSIRANRELELRIVNELRKLFPISAVVVEQVKARTKPGCSFSPVMVGQKQMLSWLLEKGPVFTQLGWETSTLRQHLGLEKTKNKAARTPESHANDAIALAASQFMQYEKRNDNTSSGHVWTGNVQVTKAPFVVIRRPDYYRRQLHFENPLKGGLRKRKGGTVTPWGYRSGDYVAATKAGKRIFGWIGGYTQTAKTKLLSVYDASWKRLGQYTLNNVTLYQRSNGLCVQII